MAYTKNINQMFVSFKAVPSGVSSLIQIWKRIQHRKQSLMIILKDGENKLSSLEKF